MSRSTISTFQLFEMFPDQDSARVYLEGLLWPQGPRCLVCGTGDKITARKGGYYRCRQCREDFTVRTGTVFERSHVPLHKWVYAMYLLVTARKGISSMQLAKEIGVTQKTAWFILGRLREACGSDFGKLVGTIEIDETYVGGTEANKQAAHAGPAGKLRQRRSRQAADLQGADRMSAMGALLELVNERGNEIAIDAKRGPALDEITLRIVGPLSESTNVVTEQEARAIYRTLGHVLDI